MEIKEAIQSIANGKLTMIGVGAKQALTNDNDLMMFVNQITDQASEKGFNKQRLEKMFGKDVIETILDYGKKKAVEQDYLVMNKCIEEDLIAEQSQPKTQLLHILLTPDVLQKKPSTTKTPFNYGRLQVVFNRDINNTKTGLHCIVEDTKENLINWLNQFEEVIIGSGTPMFESFTKMNINEKLK